MGSAGFGDAICFVASLIVESTGLMIGDAVTVSDVTSHFGSAVNGF